MPWLRTVSVTANPPPGAATAGGSPRAATARSGRVTCTAVAEARQLFVSLASTTAFAASAQANT